MTHPTPPERARERAPQKRSEQSQDEIMAEQQARNEDPSRHAFVADPNWGDCCKLCGENECAHSDYEPQGGSHE